MKIKVDKIRPNKRIVFDEEKRLLAEAYLKGMHRGMVIMRDHFSMVLNEIRKKKEDGEIKHTS